MELFSLIGKIAIDSSGANTAVDSIEKKLSSFVDKMGNFGKSVSGFGDKLTTTVTAAGTAIGGLAINSAIKFEDSIANINTLLDDDSHLKGYEDAIKTLSNETGISLNIVSEGMYQTISSIGDGGAATERMFEIMGRSAKAGGAEVSDSVSLISAGMKGYNQVNEETAQKISDLGFQTAKLGVTTFPELAKSMQPLFPLSSGLGLSYEELFGVMATGTGVTGNTAEVTTQFKAVLSNLMSPTTEMTKLIEKYGYSNAQAMLESEGLSGVLKLVQNETGGQADKMAQLFSSTEAVTLMTALTGAQFDNFNYKLGEMQNATGATDTAYNKLNTSGDKIRITWNQLKNTLTDLGGTLLTTFGPTIEKVCEKVKQFCTWFTNLDDGTKKTIITISGIVIAAGPVLSVVGRVISGIGGIIKVGGGLIGGIGKIGISIGNIMGVGGKLVGGIVSIGTKIGGVLIPAIASVGAPVLIVIGVIGALIGIGVALYKNWDAVKEFASNCWEGIKNVVSGAAEAIGGFFSGMATKASETWENIKESVSSKASEMATNASAKVSELKENASQKWEELKTKTSDAWNNISEKVSTKAEELKEKASTKITELKEKASEKWNEMREKTSEAWDNISEKVSSKASELKEKAESKITELKEATSQRWEELRTKTSNAWENISEKVSTKASELKEKAESKITALKDNASQKWEQLKTKTSDTWGKISSTVGDMANSAKEKAGDAFGNMVTGISDKMGSLFTVVSDGFNRAVDFIKNLASNAWNWGADMIDGFVGGITSGLGKITNGISSVAEEITSWIHFSVPDVGPLTEYESWMPDFMMGLAEGIDKNKWRVSNAVKGLTEDMVIPDMDYSMNLNTYQGYQSNPSAHIRSSSDSKTNQLFMEMKEMFETFSKGLDGAKVVLSTGETIGALAVPMSEELGKIVDKKGRGV